MSDYDGSEQTMVPGTLRGYRAWIPGGDGPLYSMNASYRWKRVNVASCDRARSDHEAPLRGCTCGFYARHTLDGVEHLYRGAGVLGSIKAHGRVILGTQGLRAEKAEIEAICLARFAPILERALRRFYGDIPIYHDREAFLADFPPIPVDHLLPPDPYVTPELWARMIVLSQAVTGIRIEKEQSE